MDTSQDVEGHKLAANDNETVIDDIVPDAGSTGPALPQNDDDDVEGHKLAANDNEVVIQD